ncbi:hypothetical protein PMAYCL1PPCAC_13542, partial [Pristionchus mayeri]
LTEGSKFFTILRMELSPLKITETRPSDDCLRNSHTTLFHSSIVITAFTLAERAERITSISFHQVEKSDVKRFE